MLLLLDLWLVFVTLCTSFILLLDNNDLVRPSTRRRFWIEVRRRWLHELRGQLLHEHQPVGLMLEVALIVLIWFSVVDDERTRVGPKRVALLPDLARLLLEDDLGWSTLLWQASLRRAGTLNPR